LEDRASLSATLGAWARRLALLALLAVPAVAPCVELPAAAQEGDLIFREGTEAISVAVMALDPSGFSHVGMLVKRQDRWAVLHATPSERPDAADGVVIDTLDFFVHPDRARRYEIHHVDADGEIRRRAVANAMRSVGRPFLVSDPRGTYCTRLMWEAWRDAGMDLGVRFDFLSIPLLAGEYLLPSALLRSARLRALQ
jgi:cell wall-associated NlpC family hydrolase